MSNQFGTHTQDPKSQPIIWKILNAIIYRKLNYFS